MSYEDNERYRADEDPHAVGNAYADPNAYDDRKVGRSFAETTGDRRSRGQDRPKKPPQPYKVLVVFLVCVVVLFLLILLLGWLPRHRRDAETKERAAAARNDVPVVEAVKVTRSKDAAGLEIPGTTTPLEEAYVYGRASGYLKRRLVDIGDHVRAGQLLAVIDAPDLDRQVDQAREQVRQAEAQLAQQQAQLALNKVTVERYRALVAKGVFSRQDGDQAEANYQTAVANVASAQRNVEAFKANLGHEIALQGYERVTAPFAGVVTERNVDVGALISAGGSGSGPSPTPAQTGTGSQAGATNSSGATGLASTLATPATGGAQGGALFAIAQTERLRILVSVPESYAGMVHRGQQASVYFQELPHEKFTGEVTRTADAIDQNTRTLLTEVQVDNHAGKLLAGMYAVVTFNQTAAFAASLPLLVAGDAIAIRNNRPTVAVIDGNGIVHLVAVEIGRDFGGQTEIVNGLKDGDTIAATFTDDVVEGAKVKPHFDPHAAAGGGSKP